jgi:hypothetical protein
MTITATLIGAAILGYLYAGSTGGSGGVPARRAGARNALATRGIAGPTRSPDLIQPTTLATLPNGNVLILDSSRDQILELGPSGALSVFAGNGRLGFSGDGGPAADTELDFGYFSSAGMSVTAGGSVDFLDDGNCRVRQVASDGTVRTLVRIPRAKVRGGPRAPACPADGVGISPSGTLYVATSSEIERLGSGGRLVRVAGGNGLMADQPAQPTPATVVFSPGAIAFDSAGDLYIGSFEPKAVYRLTPSGKLTNLGASYPTALAAEPNGSVVVGTHFGVIQQATSAGTHLRLHYNVDPMHVRGLNWTHAGFQENGIAVTGNGTVYVDNAEGNGYGTATVLVRISRANRAALVPIRTSLTASLPKLGASGFPASLFPLPRAARTAGRTSCPSNAGLQRFTPAAVAASRTIARTYLSSQFASDIAVTDRSWWTNDFADFTSGDDLGRHTVTGETAASNTAAATELEHACGSALVNDSIAVAVGASAYSTFAGTLYFLDRGGHPLVYSVNR